MDLQRRAHDAAVCFPMGRRARFFVRPISSPATHDRASRTTNRNAARIDHHRYHNAMKQSSKRLISVFIALIFIMAAFIFFFDFVQPTYSDMNTLRSKQLGEENYIANQSALVKQVQTILATYQNEAQGAANVDLAMPSGEDVAGALAQIEGIATNNGMSIGSIAVTAPAIRVQATAAGVVVSSSTLMKPLGSFTFKLAASGSYENFKNFLSEIETNIRIFDVKTVSLQPVAVTVPVVGKAPLLRRCVQLYDNGRNLLSNAINPWQSSSKRKRKSSNILAFLGWFVVLAIIIAAVYYIFFVEPPSAIILPTGTLQSVGSLPVSGVNPRTWCRTMNSRRFISMLPNRLRPVRCPWGVQNPFIVP